uniref:Uncharacterized protein n=1 Tax=Trichuris muris TaxID=70415 RepID=A0A5S6QFX2_TRIMR
MASEIPVQSNNEVICNDVQITTGVEEVGVADHASNANISPNGFHLVALLSVQLRVLNDSEKDRLSAPEKLFWSFSDRFSAGVLSKCGSWVAKYHEHDSLLKNIVKETLTDEERKATGVEYEKANRVTTSGRIDVTRSRKSPRMTTSRRFRFFVARSVTTLKPQYRSIWLHRPPPGQGALSPP